MRIALVDDDEIQIELLSRLITDELNTLGDLAHSIHTYKSGEAFLADWQPGDFDLIILDIYMGAMIGVEVAYKIREQDEYVPLAFCTTSNEFASESYDVGANHYLRKPVNQESISRMFRRLNLKAMELTRTIKLPDGCTLLLRSILYTEYNNHTVTVYSQHEAPHRLRTSQTEIETMLFPCGYFCSPHKGLTVNFHSIHSLTDTDITLCDGTVLPLSRRKAKEVRENYKRFRLDQIRKEVGG